MGLFGARDALLIVDRATLYVDAFPLKSKSAKDALWAFNEYFGEDTPKDVYVWSDSAHELTSAVKTLGLPHGKGTPGRHTANGYCEQWIRRVIDGARTLLEQLTHEAPAVCRGAGARGPRRGVLGRGCAAAAAATTLRLYPWHSPAKALDSVEAAQT